MKIVDRIMKTLHKNIFFIAVLVISYFSGLITGASFGTSYSKCLHSGWIPYKNEKCLKILNIYETHSSAISSCQKQLLFDDLIDINIPATLLTINSRDEAAFVDKLLFNISRYADNVWLGAVRDGPRAQFKWLDGTSLNNFSIFTKWAFGNPTGDFDKNCVELRSGNGASAASGGGGGGGFGFGVSGAPEEGPTATQSPLGIGLAESSTAGSGGSWWSSNPSSVMNISNPNPNAFFSRGDGNWYNVPCTKHNLVVCQISQAIPDQIVHLQLAKSRTEINQLKMEIQELQKSSKAELLELQRSSKAETQELRRLIGELAANVVTDIRFGTKETTDIWQGTGFPDGGGYVITGALNWDEDATIDTVSRRKVQKFVNGQWYDIY